MTYITYVWILILHNPGTISVMICNMLVFFCFLRPRRKWWFYPLFLTITIFALPMVYSLSKTLNGPKLTTGIFLTCLGYWNIILILISYCEQVLKMLSLIFTLCILNRMFTFWGYILYISLHANAGNIMDIQLSITLVITTMYVIILLVCWLTLRVKGRALIQTGLRHYSWAILAGIAVSAKLIIDFCSDYAFSLSPYSDIKIIWAMIALCAFAVAVLALYLYSTFTTLKHSELKSAADHLIFEKAALQRYYETQLHNQEELHRMKHDMNGHLNTISQLLEEDKKDEALSYLINLGNYTNNHQKILYCNNPYLNAVLTNYATIFNDNEILFEFDIQLGKIELHYIEMCLALNNAFQNALEASLKLQSTQRYVKLQVKTKQSRLLFRITNRFNRFDIKLQIDSGLPYSTKEGTDHGYGLNSIRDAAESVGGFIDFKSEDDMFVLDVAM